MLDDLTLVIPFKYDFEDRIQNLRFVLRYYKKHFPGVKFVIIESAPEQKGAEFEGMENVQYEYRQEGGFIHRTKMLNDGAKMSTTDYISCYDTDVFFNKNGLIGTMNALRQGQVFVLPFNGIFLDVFGKVKDDVINTLDVEKFPVINKVIPRNYMVDPNGLKCIVFDSVGGATFFNRKRFLELGGYNEKFISWGYEDNEIIHRFKTMGNDIVRINNSNCYHMTHRRGKDSQAVHDHTASNRKELAYVKTLDRNQLQQYITTELLK